MTTAQQSTADSSRIVSVRLGGFTDVYYAYDFARPPKIDRPFTTQAARHNEFNVNLAFIEAVAAGASVRGRIALQAGSSVQANYASEPRVGTISGPEVSRFLQEATAGVRVAQMVWIDAGIFFSHIGSESWISRDNPTYTRSLAADFTPYYETGIRATWTPRPTFSAQLNLLNGWQNVSETNSDKAIGLRFDYALFPSLSFAYDNFFGNEAPDSVPSRTRVFHELTVRANPTKRVQLLALAQRGTERRARRSGSAAWSGAVAIGRVELTPRIATAARVEFYSDPEQVIVPTGIMAGFRAHGASLGLDALVAPGVSWRNEIRSLRFADAVYPARPDGRLVRSDLFVVTALNLTIAASFSPH
ncbi:MAG: porin [Gemmatimonadota bacterium]|nr:porin [Gemmatimonadota bacterium]